MKWTFHASGIMLMAGSLSAMSHQAPTAMIPPSSHPVTLDGRLSPAEWDDAAVLYFTGRDNHLAAAPDAPPAAPVITACHLKYDRQFLWVGWLCREHVGGYPRACPRTPTDDLTQDDAVQVVLGVADEHNLVREVLNMGGYKGAMGTEAARADHYYQFTTNAANARSRTYNESILQHPRFTSAVAETPDGWSVEMRLPWSAWGLDDLEGRTIYMNLFRFRPPGRSGWYHPDFGGYVPMQFGRLTLLPPGEAARRTLMSPPDTAPKPAKTKPTSASPHGEISYHPLSGAVVATLHNPSRFTNATATFEVEGAARTTRTLDGTARQRLIIDIKPGSQPARKAVLRITGPQGKSLFETTETFAPVQAPEWLGTDAGIEYLDRKIPQPWTQPVVEGHTVHLLGKTLRIGPYGLFDSITDAAGDMLAGPAEVQVDIDGKALRFHPTPPVVEAAGTAVRVHAAATAGAYRLESRSLIDYDGFTVVKMRLRGAAPEHITRLTLRLPLLPRLARFAHRNLVQNVKPLTGFGYEAPAGPLWVGSESKGLAFSFDSPVFFSRQRRTQMRVIEGDKNKTWMEFTFVDGPGQVPRKETIFRFFLQPTPTKPVPLEKTHPRVAWKWENWSDWQGYPDLAKMSSLKKWSETLHREGRLALLYTCQGMAADAPGFQAHKDDLMVWPPWIHYRRGYNPGKNVPCYHVCKRGPEGDLQLWALQKLAREGGIDGTVSDGLSLAWSCDNPGHTHGCGRPQPITWENDARSRVVETRNFLKRLRGIFNETGRPFYLSAHCGGGLDIHTLSFFDGYMEGEQLSRFRPGYMIPRYIYAVGYNGYPWGFRTEFWDKGWRRTRGWYWSLTFALLHDNEIHDRPLVQEICRGFDDEAGTTYYPYWQPGPHVRLQSHHSFTSYYLRENKALVIVSNLSFEDDPIDLDLSRLLPGKPLTAVDLLSHRAMPLKDRRIHTTLPGYHCLALSVSHSPARLDPNPAAPKTTPAPAPFTLKGHDSSLWRTNAAHPTVTANPAANLGNGRTGMDLGSKLYGALAEATLQGYTLGRNGTIILWVRFDQRFRLGIGPVEIHHDAGWRMLGPLAGWNTGTVYQVPVDPDTVYPLIVTLHDGHLDATLGDRGLVRDMAFDMPDDGNHIAVRTWAGNHVTFALEKLTTKPRQLYRTSISHPVR